MAVVTSSSVAAGFLRLGAYQFGPNVAASCVVTVKPKSKGKVDKKAADGKNDAITTWKGQEPASLTIDLTWNGANLAVDRAVTANLYQISPRGPNAGQPMACAFKDSRIHGVSSLIVEELEGPERKPGTDLVTAKITATSWVQPAQTGQGAATTPKAADPATPPAAGGSTYVPPIIVPDFTNPGTGPTVMP